MMHQYAQKEDGWCGPAALCFALHEQGVDVDQEAMVKETGTTIKDGIDPKSLEDAAEAHGMETHVLQGENAKDTIDVLNFYKKNGWSIILDYLAGDSLDDGHYVVLLEVMKDGLKVFDPSNGGSEKVLQKDDFIAHWRDKNEDGDVFRHYALIMTKDLEERE